MMAAFPYSLLSLTVFILLTMIASTLNTLSSAAKDDLVACTMCVECENPCKLPPPPPPVKECPPPPLPVVIECPPPPSLPILPPPPPVETSPPPPPPMPPMRPPPPRRPRPCPPGKICVFPPRPPFGVGNYYYSPNFPTGTTPRNYDFIYNKSGKLVPFSAMLLYVAFLCLPYYLFII